MRQTKSDRNLFGEPVNLGLIASTIWAGWLSWAIGSRMQEAFFNDLTGPQTIAALFLLLYIVVSAVVSFGGAATRPCQSDIFKGDRTLARHLAVFLAGAAVLLGASYAFEVIYEFEVETDETPPSSLVFLIDDSGSMLYNDPGGKRYAAIASAATEAGDDVPYAVYRFSDAVELVRGMAEASEGTALEPGKADGATCMGAAFEKLLDDFDRGKFDYGDNPRVVLLSDGVPTDISQADLLNDYVPAFAERRISVSSIALGTEDERFMRRIASMTDGVFLSAPNAEELEAGMEKAARESASRTLLSDRGYLQADWVYALMRITFLLVLGLLVGALAAVAYGRRSSVPTVMVATIFTSAAGAFAMEGLCAAGYDPNEAWLLLWVLIALTVARRPKNSRFASQGLWRRGLSGKARI